MSDFISIFYGTARKDHPCDECCDGIAEGTKYRRACGRYDGEFYSTKACLRCSDAITRAYNEGLLSDGYNIGDFWASIPFDASWNPPKEKTHRLEVWLTPDSWMTGWNGVPDVSNPQYTGDVHSWGNLEHAKAAVATLDPDGTKFPSVEYRWVEKET